MSASSCSSSSEPPSYKELLSTCDNLSLTNAELSTKLARQDQELELLKYQLEQLKQRIFGRTSEKLQPEDPDLPIQGNLFETPEIKPSESEGEDEYIEVQKHKKRKRSKKSIPKDLPVDEVIIEPSETHCSCCDEELKEFARDTREEVEFEPARFFKRQYVTIHKSCPKCKDTCSGKTPEENKPVIPGAQVGPGLLAHIVTSKFCDHVPYFRLSKIYAREGVILPDKTLGRYGLAVGALLEPIAKAIKAQLLKKGYLQADETRLEVLEPRVRGSTHRGQLWLLSDPLGSLTYYEYHDNRSKRAARSLLGEFCGALQTDAYTCYNEHPGIQLGCMAHARRYFVEAKQLVSKECKLVVRLIGKLYKIESNLRKFRDKLTAANWHQKRLEVRKQLSTPILEELKIYLQSIKDRWLLERHPMYKAVNYMLNRYQSFCQYTEDGKFEIDNNLAENMMRPVALGRKNWLFSGSEHGAKMNAVMMSVVQTCLRLGVNPQKYLTYALPRLASQKTTSLDGLMPWDFCPSR